MAQGYAPERKEDMGAGSVSAQGIGASLVEHVYGKVTYEEFATIAADLIDNVIDGHLDTIASLSRDVATLSSRVRQFDDTTKVVGAMADTIAQRIAREIGREVRKIRKYGR